MMYLRGYCLFFIALAVLSLGLFGERVIAAMTSDNYQIFGDVISSGGTVDSSSNNYNLLDTIGEAMILSATSTSANYGLKAGFQELYVDQYLTFSVGSTSINLGTLSDSTPGTASHTMTVDTNAIGGYTVTASGATLTSGANTITAIGGTAAASAAGSEQFGLNLVANTVPTVGSSPSGTSPIGSASAPFATANQFAFDDTTTNTVATATTDVNQTVFTVSYLANIAAGTESGTYTTTITYSATANF